jgi:hypothetical protein
MASGAYDGTGTRRERLARRLRTELAERLSPDRTRRATLFEQKTVGLLSWDWLVRLNRYLELAGKLATVVWLGFVATVVLGVDWKEVVQDTVNSGKPVKGAIALVLIVPTLLFVAARSLIGFARWRLQRELWRRDVARLEQRRSRPHVSRQALPAAKTATAAALRLRGPGPRSGTPPRARSCLSAPVPRRSR